MTLVRTSRATRALVCKDDVSAADGAVGHGELDGCGGGQSCSVCRDDTSLGVDHNRSGLGGPLGYSSPVAGTDANSWCVGNGVVGWGGDVKPRWDVRGIGHGELGDLAPWHLHHFIQVRQGGHQVPKVGTDDRLR